jgi:hypothetical protein
MYIFCDGELEKPKTSVWSAAACRRFLVRKLARTPHRHAKSATRAASKLALPSG